MIVDLSRGGCTTGGDLNCGIRYRFAGRLLAANSPDMYVTFLGSYCEASTKSSAACEFRPAFKWHVARPPYAGANSLFLVITVVKSVIAASQSSASWSAIPLLYKVLQSS